LFQVAITKNLGLQTLRLASALVLPFNTTHYAFELESYLDRSVKPSKAYRPSYTCTFGRVEVLAAASSAAVNFIPLRAAIKSLQFASLELDAEKLAAERILNRYLRKWRKRHSKRKNNRFKCFIRRLKGIFAIENQEIQEQHQVDGADRTAHKSDGEVDVQDGKWPQHRHHPHHPHWLNRLYWPRWPPRKPHRVPRKFIKAVKAVRKINQKLVSFERGFIHEEGIKDREWFRHLGVAPGKWLGKV
jgi:N-acetylated-alpha-linked acidic dipeptidase